jgi:hypothetical protein
MVLCEWDAPEGDPGQSCVHLFARILSTSFSSVSIFSVCCYSIVSISMVLPEFTGYHLGCLRKWLLEFRESRNLYENGANFAKFRVIFHKSRLSLKEWRHGMKEGL